MRGIGGRTASAWVAALALVATGCTSAPTPSSTTPAPATSTATPAAQSQAVEAGNYEILVPAAALDAGQSITASLVEPPEQPPAGIEPVGQAVSVDVMGGDGRLTGAAEAQVLVHPDSPPTTDEVVGVLWEDGRGGWQVLPTVREGASYRATTSHLSIGFFARVNPEQIAEDMVDDVTRYLSGRVDVAQPSCGDEQALREAGIEVVSDWGDSVKWCAGIQDGAPVVKVANNRRAFTSIVYPSDWTVLNESTAGFSIDAAARSLGATWAALGTGRAGRTIDGGDTLVLQLPEGGTGQVTATVDGLATMVTALYFAADVLLAIASSVYKGAVPAATTLKQDLIAAFSGTAVDARLTSALLDCTKAISDSYGDATGNDSSVQVAKQTVQFAASCGPAVVRASSSVLSTVGNALVVGFLASAVGIVATAIHLAVVSVRSIWDDIAAFGGSSDPVYDISVYARDQTSIPVDPDKQLTWLYLLPIDADRGQADRADVLLPDADGTQVRMPNSTRQWVGCDGAPATARVDLSGRFTRFRAWAGLRPGTPDDVTVDFTVAAEGVELSRVEVSPSSGARIDVDVTGVDVLVLSAERIAGTCQADPVAYGVWGDGAVVGPPGEAGPQGSPPESDESPTAPGGSWPTGDNDGSPIFWTMLGVELVFPDWVSCSASGRLCLVGSGSQVLVYDAAELERIGTVPAVDDPVAALKRLGLPDNEITEALTPGAP